MMWYPAKAAFRAGRVGDTKDGTQWDASEVGDYSTAFGRDTKASGIAATAMGTGTTASGSQATAMGDQSDATGYAATAAGRGTEAGAFAATAMGQFATATGEQATAIGNRTTASGNAATALGNRAEASGDAATAMGSRTTASGMASLAMGDATVAAKDGATAMGVATEANAFAATAMGSATTAGSPNSLAIGTYNSANTSSDGTLFVVGNGTARSTSDAMVLKQNGNLAIGPSDPQALRLHVAEDKANAGVNDDPAANVVLLENTNTGTNPDVLGLQAGPTNPGGGVTYVSFYDRFGTTVGGIEGNGSGGINYTSSGADFAEELPVASGTATPDAGDVVAVRGGEVNLNTSGGERLMVVSDQAAMTGNVKPDATGRRVPVAFVGQVPVRLRGTAEAGDLVVASGANDGTARAVAPNQYRPAEHGPLVGTAWSAKASNEPGTITTVVGLGKSGVLAKQLHEQQSEIASLRKRVERLETLEARLARLEDSTSPELPAGATGTMLLVGLLFGAGLLWHRRRA